MAAFALTGNNVSAAVAKEALTPLAVRKLIRVPPLTYYSTPHHKRTTTVAVMPLAQRLVIFLFLNQDEKAARKKMYGIIHFFQTIKAHQNYFAILAKMMISLLRIVDFSNKNKSLA